MRQVQTETRGTLKGTTRKTTKTITFSLIAVAASGFILSGSVSAKEFCLSNIYGIRLTADADLVETAVSEQNRMYGSVCEMESLSDGAFKVTVFAHKTFKKEIRETSLDDFSESTLSGFKDSFDPDMAIVDKKEVLVPQAGYLLTLRSRKMECLIVHFATVTSGLMYVVGFTFPENKTAKYMPLVQETLKGLGFANQIPLVALINNMKFSLFQLNTVRIPYPRDWKIYSAGNIDELRKSEAEDQFYSTLILRKEATHVFKSKYENEQLFTMTAAVSPKQLDLEHLYPLVRQQVNDLFQKDYGSDYVDNSLGKIVIKGRPYYCFIFESTRAANHFVIYQFWFVNKGFTYAIKFKSHPILFQMFKKKMDAVIENIEY